MYEWNEAVQKMIDWIEKNLDRNPYLLEMSGQIGYSPFYCSSQFHQLVGISLKSYIAKRRLCAAALALRDTDQRILDIALACGFSSQQTLTRAFVDAYGCTPAAYRKNPGPIQISIKKNVLFPEHYENSKGEMIMSKTMLTEPSVRVEYIPAHKYIGIWDDRVQDYFSFWEHHNCDDVCGVIDSMSHVMHPVVTGHTAGWYYENEKKGYFYGLGVPLDYDGEIPEGFEVKEFPESYYLVFYHPPFDFLKNCNEVMPKVDQMAFSFDPSAKGFQWNEEICQDYQRSLPETIGYEVLRPVKPL